MKRIICKLSISLLTLLLFAFVAYTYSNGTDATGKAMISYRNSDGIVQQVPSGRSTALKLLQQNQRNNANNSEGYQPYTPTRLEWLMVK